MFVRWSLALVVALGARAFAQPAGSDRTPASGEAPADHWTDAPPADQASGIARDEAPPASEHVRRVTRAVLFVPRWVVWGVAQPVRGGAYVYERYNLPGVLRRTFFSVDEVFGVYPTAGFESGFGVTGGARLVHRDLFGAGERVKLRASFGGRYQYATGANLRSGRRLGPYAALELDVGYERRPSERFFGIGNADETAMLPTTLASPVAAAYSTRFREDMLRVLGRIDVRLAGPLQVRVAGAATSRTLAGTGDADSLDQVYATAMVAGWDGIASLRSEAELVYDSRRQSSPYMTRAIDSTGWFASVHAGITTGLWGDAWQFRDYGIEVQRFIDLYRGSRVLALRALVDSVVGGPVSFLDLPRLGGGDLLRGYPAGRFRDRAIGLVSAEYTWDLGNFLAGYLFVDAGRAWTALDVATTDRMRVGVGGGVQVHTMQSYLGRAQLAASRDGDVFVELVLSPAFARRERVGRP